MTSCPSLRERHREQTRQLIHQATVELAGELGFAHVTVESISSRAGISPRTFFNYFPSKEAAVILGPPVELREPHASAFLEGPTSTPRQLLIELTQILLTQLESNPPDRRTSEDVFSISAANADVLAALVAQMDQVRADLAELVAQRLPEGTDRQVSDIIASLAMAAMRSGLETWATTKSSSGEQSPVRYVRRAVEIMTSLAAEPVS